MAEKNEGLCEAGPKLVFACSGAADVGAIADQAARKLTREGVGKMYCTTGLGGRIPPILEMTKTASMVLALDGCPLDCVRHSLEEAGFTDFAHVRVTDLDMKKGQTPVSEENIARVADQSQSILG